MELKDMMTHNYGGFTLDMDKIGNTSIDKRNIVLPYTGRLPEPYDSATVIFRVSPERCGVVLEARSGNNKLARYIVTASRDEVDGIMWRFFFEPHGRTERTRFDCGLSEYWLGGYQAEFLAWHKISNVPTTVCEMLWQLTAEQRASVYSMIKRMELEEITEG